MVEIDHSVINSYQILLGIAEYLKIPLTQINNQVELINLGVDKDFKQISDLSSFAIELIDNYVLGLKLNSNKNMIRRDIHSISSIFYDSAEILNNFAKQYNIELRINVANNLNPVITDKKAMQGVLVSLGGTIIESASTTESKFVTLATHKCRYGLVAGVYTDEMDLGRNLLRQGLNIHSSARRPFPKLSHTNSAGIFVAEQILNSLDMHLLSSKHQRLRGIGTLLTSSEQLSLV